MENSGSFAAACLAATLVTAWNAAPADAGVPTEVYRVDIAATAGDAPTVDLRSVSLMHGFNSLTFIGSDLQVGFGHWSGTLILSSGANFARGWTFAAVTNDGTTDHLVLALPNGGVAGIGHDFSTLLPNDGIDEAVFIQALASRDYNKSSPILARFHEVYPNLMDEPGKLVSFSTGVGVGSITVSITPVPEPTSLAALASALAVALRRKRCWSAEN